MAAWRDILARVSSGAKTRYSISKHGGMANKMKAAIAQQWRKKSAASSRQHLISIGE